MNEGAHNSKLVGVIWEIVVLQGWHWSQAGWMRVNQNNLRLQNSVILSASAFRSQVSLYNMRGGANRGHAGYRESCLAPPQGPRLWEESHWPGRAFHCSLVADSLPILQIRHSKPKDRYLKVRYQSETGSKRSRVCAKGVPQHLQPMKGWMK